MQSRVYDKTKSTVNQCSPRKTDGRESRRAKAKRLRSDRRAALSFSRRYSISKRSASRILFFGVPPKSESLRDDPFFSNQRGYCAPLRRTAPAKLSPVFLRSCRSGFYDRKKHFSRWREPAPWLRPPRVGLKKNIAGLCLAVFWVAAGLRGRAWGCAVAVSFSFVSGVVAVRVARVGCAPVRRWVRRRSASGVWCAVRLGWGFGPRCVLRSGLVRGRLSLLGRWSLGAALGFRRVRSPRLRAWSGAGC